MDRLRYKTLEKWKSLYSRGGLDALMPTVRSDKGISRSLNDEAIAEIYRIKNDRPRMNATQIHEHLIKDSFLPATVSVDSVQRFIRSNDLRSARDPNLRDRKAYEEDEFGKIWQADTCACPPSAWLIFTNSSVPSSVYPIKAVRPVCSKPSRNRSPICTKKKDSPCSWPLMKPST